MQTKFQQLIGWPSSPRPNTKTPLIPRMGLFASIVTWWTMSRELTQMAKRITGDSYYNDNRHAIIASAKAEVLMIEALGAKETKSSLWREKPMLGMFKTPEQIGATS